MNRNIFGSGRRAAIFKNMLTLALITALVFALAACGGSAGAGGADSPEGELRDVTVVLDYVPNTNHTGLYVAKELGYYEEEGLNVNIVEPMDGVAISLTAAGKADFGIGYQEDVTYAVEQDVPIKAIATIIQHNTSGFAALASSGITGPADFEGKTYVGWGSPSESAVIEAVMKGAGADFSKVKIIGTDSYDYTDLGKNADFIWLFEAWDKISAERNGLELNYMAARDLDERLDYYTPVIVASRDVISGDPDLCRAFMNATKKGYEYAIENPDEAAGILYKYCDAYDPDMLKESQEYLADKYAADAGTWGVMKDSVWSGYSEFMKEYGLIENAPDPGDCYTNEFLI